MARRPTRPARVDLGIQMLCGFRCCICGITNIQIHHIDGDPSNNEPSNLVGLCLPHHDQAEQGKSQHGQSLSLKLTKQLLSESKNRTELTHARRLGFADVQAFWKSHLEKLSPTPCAAPTYLGGAFKDWIGWEHQLKQIAAMDGDTTRRYNFRVAYLEGELWVTATAALPGTDVKPLTGWIKHGDDLILPMSEDIKKQWALTTFEHLPLDRQTHTLNTALEKLDDKKIFDDVGVLAQFRLNGPQPWPTGEPELELGVWLQHIGILWHYFGLLGDAAKDWQRLAREMARLRAANKSASEWTVSVWDALLAERIGFLLPVIRGKAEALRQFLEAPVKLYIGINLSEAVRKFTTVVEWNDWQNLVDAVNTAIGSACAPEKLENALNFPNPLLHYFSVISYKGGKFKMPVPMKVTGALLTNTKMDYMKPSEKAGLCNLHLNFSNSYLINIFPSERPSDEVAFAESLKDIKLTTLLKAFREGQKGFEYQLPF